MKGIILFVVVAIACSKQALAQEEDSSEDEGFGSTGGYGTEDYNGTTERAFEGQDNDEPETVGACSKTMLNVDINDVDYAWTVEGLAKYMRAYGVKGFMESNFSLAMNDVSISETGLPGKWSFRIKRDYCPFTYKPVVSVAAVYNHTERPSVVIRPQLFLKVKDQTIKSEFTKEDSYESVVYAPYKPTTTPRSFLYNNQHASTTASPLRIHYIQQATFVFTEENLAHLLGGNRDNNNTRRHHAHPRGDGVKGNCGDMELIFNIKLIQKDPSPAVSAVSSSCETPNFRSVKRSFMKNEMKFHAHPSGMPPMMMGGGGSNFSSFGSGGRYHG